MNSVSGILKIYLPDVRRDLYSGIVECNKRCLIQSSKWLAELNQGLKHIDLEGELNIEKEMLSGISFEDLDNYNLAKVYFQLKEYDRAAFFVKDCESPVPRFLHFYSMYMSKMKKKLDSSTDISILNNSGYQKDLSELLSKLHNEYERERLDGYCLYLYGIILKKLDLNERALEVFVESVNAEPLLWGSWAEMASLLDEKDDIERLNLPDHWMRQLFIGYAYIELLLNDDGLKQWEDLQAAGMDKCIFITSQIAIAHHNKRDVDKAIELLQILREVDPYRLDNLDILSNLLFVKELKAEMAALAHRVVEIDKYRPETCCVIGNYYSIRSDHEKAILYFQRALKLNPHYLSAWTLMGHEYMELKNSNAAIQSYRKAVEVNKRDYRAWYGLGQSYEILKLHFYSLYYFKVAQQLRPHDSRMLVALGETYEKLDKIDNAIKCFRKACSVGDIEGVALFKLGKLYERQNDLDNAVAAYLEYCKDERSTVERGNKFHVYLFLAHYYTNKGNLEEASHFAYKCLESEEKKNDARSLLKVIENKRAMQPRQRPTDCEEETDYNAVCMEECEMVVETPENDVIIMEESLGSVLDDDDGDPEDVGSHV